MPSFEPQKWNDGDGIQYGNNCYDYAIDRPSGKRFHKSQPGKARGHQLNYPFTCEDVTDGALKDGLRRSNKDDACERGCWKVALAVDPTPPSDYHWYRQGDNGKWSHKPGWGRATNMDFDAPPKEIDNPETAAPGRYSDFCGYFCVCPDQVDVVMATPPGRPGPFATITLTGKGLLEAPGVKIELPPGLLSIWYEKERMPMNAVTIYVGLYSGREDPNWQLEGKDLETLQAKLIDLPERGTEVVPGAGYQGFYLANPAGLPGLPQWGHVYRRCISMTDGEGNIRYYEDVHHLEEWLITLAGSLPFGHEIQGVLAKSRGQASTRRAV